MGPVAPAPIAHVPPWLCADRRKRPKRSVARNGGRVTTVAGGGVLERGAFDDGRGRWHRCRRFVRDRAARSTVAAVAFSWAAGHAGVGQKHRTSGACRCRSRSPRAHAGHGQDVCSGPSASCHAQDARRASGWPQATQSLRVPRPAGRAVTPRPPRPRSSSPSPRRAPSAFWRRACRCRAGSTRAETPPARPSTAARSRHR